LKRLLADAEFETRNSRESIIPTFGSFEGAFAHALRNAAGALIHSAEELALRTAEVTALKAANEEMLAAKDGAYHERDMVVAALSKCFPSHLSRHSDEDTAWEDDWRWIVYIELPTGQASWHIHDSEFDLFNHLEVRPNNWDGHNTERKYKRLAAVRTTITYIDEWKETERKLRAAELANEEMRGRLEQENSELWAHLGEARAMSERLRGRLEKAERVVSAVAALRQKQAITMDDQQRVWDALSVYSKETVCD
jgi:hypothetical protein